MVRQASEFCVVGKVQNYYPYTLYFHNVCRLSNV